MRRATSRGWYGRHGKRLLDVALAGPALVLVSPVLVLAAAAVLVLMGRPVFIRQQRPGLAGRSFVMLKLRTMVQAEGCDLSQDAARLTPLGRFLRRWSIDELPQLLHVLRGEMSIVGPRPLLVQYLERYTREQARRHEVLPGLTGWAQIHGRNDLDWGRRLALDVWYVDHVSLSLDLRIIGKTIVKVIEGDGVTQAGRATVDEFRGAS
jgi:lipopolysaccharide/colanic/teichoic acid biosynthesis glycosyltransferase